ncbi:MAG: glycosyltransferase family 39 protein [Planctomycetes bacterium]|nr:glycosyltransferase family 39 protein [Planctomycetota bacterium]
MSTSSPDHVSSAPAGPSRAPLAALLVALVAFAVYLPALLHGGLVYDDVELIELNPRIRESFSLREAFTKPFWDVVDTEAEGRQPFYRPGVSLFFHLGWRLSGDQAWGYHLLNVLLHVAASLGVAALARRFAGGAVLAGAAAGLLFAVQPTHHEAVAWVAGIVDPSAVAPMVWAAVLLLRARESGKLLDYAGAFALHVAALLCKETAFLFVPLCLLGVRALPRAAEPRKLATALVLLLPPLALYAVRASVFDSSLAGFGYAVVDVHAGMEATRKLLFPLELLGHFVLLVLWPGAWAPMHVLRPGAGLGDPTVQLHLLLGGLFVASVLVMVCSRELGQRRSVHLFALLGFALGLAPALVSPQSLGQFPVSERYLYLPLALVCISLGVLVSRGLARGGLARALAFLLLLLVLPLGVLAAQRAGIYRDEATFYAAALEREPNAAVAHIGMGHVHLQRASELAASDPRAALRELDQANERFLSVTSLYTNAELYFVGFVERVRSGIGQFGALLQKATMIEDPLYREEDLKIAEQARDLVREELERFRKSLIDEAPEKAALVAEALEWPEWLVNQGILAALRGRREEARGFFLKALQRDRDHFEAQLALAQIAEQQSAELNEAPALVRTWTEVVDRARAALAISPGQARALLLLSRGLVRRAVAREATGSKTPETLAAIRTDIEDADRTLILARRLHPEEPSFPFELANLHALFRNWDNVANLFFDAVRLSQWRLDYVEQLLEVLQKSGRSEDILRLVFTLQERDPQSIPAHELLIKYLLIYGHAERAAQEIEALRKLDPEGWVASYFEAMLAEGLTGEMSRAYTSYETALARAQPYDGPKERSMRKRAAQFFVKIARATYAAAADPQREMSSEDRGRIIDQAARYYRDGVLVLSALQQPIEWLEYGELLLRAQLWCDAQKAFEAGLAEEVEAEKRQRLEQGKALAEARCKP